MYLSSSLIWTCQNQPIQRSIEFADKFPDEIKDKKQLQRFLWCLNYVSDYFKDLRIICEPLYKRLIKNAPAWTEHHTSLVKEIKQKVKHLPCISIPHPNALLIVESDASNLGYGGILKQEYNNQVHIVRYHPSSSDIHCTPIDTDEDTENGSDTICTQDI